MSGWNGDLANRTGERLCKQCSSVLVRKIDECSTKWRSRKHCDEICLMLRREEDRYAKHYGDRMVRK